MIDNSEELIHESFDCNDCGVCTFSIREYYAVKDGLWKSVVLPAERDGMLCIGCLEKRLGRELISADFIDAPIHVIFDQSERLHHRIHNKSVNRATAKPKLGLFKAEVMA